MDDPCARNTGVVGRDVTIKAVENRLDRSVEGDADSARPVGQMLSRSEMSARGELRVPVQTQLLSEARNEWLGRSRSKIANSPGRLEEQGGMTSSFHGDVTIMRSSGKSVAPPYARPNARKPPSGPHNHRLRTKFSAVHRIINSRVTMMEPV